MKKYNYFKKQIKKQQLQIYYITTSKLNMRFAPNKNSDVITVIPKNQKVLFQQTIDETWYKIKYQDYIGFCMKEFLK